MKIRVLKVQTLPCERFNHQRRKIMKNFIFYTLIICIFFTFTSLASAKSVYLLSGNDSAQDAQIETVLEGFGHVVDIGVQHWQFDGTQDISSYEVVLLLNSSNWPATFGDMPVPGQNSLVTYISSGGGLITGEWVMWNWSQGNFQTIYDALPGTTDGNWNSVTPITYTVQEEDSLLNYNMPNSFTFDVSDYDGTESVMWPKEGAHAFYDSNNLDAGLVGWHYGLGGVLSFSTCIGPSELSNTDYQQLLSNAVDWAGTPVPIPGTALLLGSGLVGLIGIWRKRGEGGG